ncbi:MAG TPA: DNA topoisomerase (ATP-hydrolyzing) [Candidatus Sulfomarinibacteraceae bacterium]|nr:DNA topoisomerase (ATP-hydrolyzing) [Candidatus Sulfomarinibacteraceae bacterium]
MTTPTTSRQLAFSKDLERSVLMYAMDTILDRALPDVRDGLKPVQRRIIFAMGHDLGLRHNRPHKKSARVVGEVLGKYHPHGDQSVYDAMVRMAQDFSMRDPLIDGQGNFGSIDGDSAAAMRYTEARLTQLAELTLQDIDDDTVRWQANFDDSLQEPTVLPSVVPNLLLNGSSGIAVAMATNIPPHNLGELCDAIEFMAGKWEKRDAITVDDLLKYVKGPDFPTGGLAFRFRDNGRSTPDDIIRKMYESGQGRLITQARVEIEPLGGGKHNIVVTQLPYMVQKTTVMERIGTEVRNGRIEGVSDVRDESDHEGMRLVVETSRGHDPNKILEGLLQYSQLRETFGAQILALVPTEDGMRPEYLSLRDALVHFISHRLVVIERRSRYEREKRRARLHIVDGLLIAMDAIDEVIATIKKSRTRDTAKTNLQRQFKLSEAQSAAIVAMPLGNLASLEVKKLKDEQRDLKARIKELNKLIKSEAARLKVVVAETSELKEKFATPRRTLILDKEEHVGETVTATDLTESQIVTLNETDAERRDCPGYADRGMTGLTSRRTSVPVGRWYAEPSERVFMVAADGDGWHAPVTQINDTVAQGKRIVGGGILHEDVQHVVLVTRQGQVKRVKVEDLPTSFANWARVIGLKKGDEVLGAGVDTGDDTEVMIFTRKGQAIRFKIGDVNPQQSASARGVTAIKIGKGDELIAAEIFEPETAGHVVVVSEKGWIKRVPMDEWPVQGRAGKGVQSLAITTKTGEVAAATVTRADDNYVDMVNEDGYRVRLKYELLPEANRRNRGDELPDVLKKHDKKDKTKMKDVGRLVRAVALSATYAYRGR